MAAVFEEGIRYTRAQDAINQSHSAGTPTLSLEFVRSAPDTLVTFFTLLQTFEVQLRRGNAHDLTESSHTQSNISLSKGESEQYGHRHMCMQPVRRLQLIEESKADGGAAAYEGARFFVRYRRMGALVAPELGRHVANKLQEDVSVMKERRKHAEERGLAAARLRKTGRRHDDNLRQWSAICSCR